MALKRGKPGAIEVAAGHDLVVMEGVGASRTELVPWIDRALWVQSDLEEAERRGIAREGGTEEARNFRHEWAAQEFDFLKRQRPWETSHGHREWYPNAAPRAQHRNHGCTNYASCFMKTRRLLCVQTPAETSGKR